MKMGPLLAKMWYFEIYTHVMFNYFLFKTIVIKRKKTKH